MNRLHRNVLYFNNCVGLNVPDRLMYDTELEQLSKTDRNPIQEQQYQSLLTQSGIPFTVGSDNRAAVSGFGAGGNGATTGQFQYASDNAQAQKQYQDAIAPAVTSLTASLPEISNNYDTQSAQLTAEKDPLKARYQSLIDQITGDTQGQVNTTTKTATNELGRRGIPISSTSAQQEIQGQVLPIQQAGQTNITNATLDREEKLKGLDDTIANLTSQKVSAQRDVYNTIAQIQAQAGTGAAQQAFQMYQSQQQQTEDALNRALQEKQLALQTTQVNAAISQPNIQAVQGGLYDTTNNKWIVPPKADTSGGTDLASLLAGITTNKATPTSSANGAALNLNSAVNSGGLNFGSGWSVVG